GEQDHRLRGKRNDAIHRANEASHSSATHRGTDPCQKPCQADSAQDRLAHRPERGEPPQFEVKQALSVFRNEQWEQKLESLNSEDNSIWKMAKILRNTRKPLPPIHGAGGIVYTDQEKAEAFADSLELQCRASFANADPDHVDEVEEEVD
ncbi:unnamed protein product, partial [Tenebrio molitor]